MEIPETVLRRLDTVPLDRRAALASEWSSCKNLDEAVRRLAPHTTAWIDDLAVNQGRGWRAGKNFDYDIANKWVKEAYNEYLLEGGKPIDFAADALSRGNAIGKSRRLGTLNECPTKIVGDAAGYRGQIQVFEHANLPTLMEKLLHFRQSRMLGAWGNRVLTPAEIARMEKYARDFLRRMGFEELPPGVLSAPGF